MSKRKTKKSKIALEKRLQERNKLILELKQKRDTLLEKEEKAKEKYLSAKKEKNKNIFKATYKLISPYCFLALGMQIPFLLSHSGFPFVIDSHTHYKEKNLEVSYDGDVNYQESYVTNYWYEDKTFPNKLTITSPWIEFPDGLKKRTIKEYYITYSDEIANAILSSDYAYLEALLDECSSEVVESTNDMSVEDCNYHVEGNIGGIDSSFSIKVPETAKTNKSITTLEVGIFIFFSIIILKFRKFRLFKSLNTIKEEFVSKENDYLIQHRIISDQLEEIDQKILSIRK